MNPKTIKFYSTLLKKAFHVYKGKFLLIILLGFLSGLAGGIGIAAVIPLFSFITEGEAEIDFVSNILRGFFSVLNINFTITSVLLTIIVLFLVKALLNFFAQYINARVSADYEHRTRIKLFKATMNASWPHLLNQKVGYLEKVLTEDIYQSTQIIFYLSNSILIASSLAMYAFVGFKISALMTIIALASGGIIIFSLKKTLFNKTKNVGGKLSQTYKVIANYINETNIGTKIIKAMSLENKTIERGNERFKELKNIRKEMSLYNAIGNVIMEPIGIVFISVLFGVMSSSPTFNIGAFAAIIYLIQKIFTFINSIQANLHQISQVLPNLQVVLAYQKNAAISAEDNKGSKPYSFNGAIAFSNVKFAYKDKKEILAELNFRIKKGEMIGLIGPSGVGKTTVADLILRLFNPINGTITADGTNIASINIKEWRKKIGYVPQDAFLLNDTIENNIKLFDDSITTESMIEAVKKANIYDFIVQQPKQFQTEVGERGVGLSGGQRQRIVLARTLVRNPDILILDEATSALDNESNVLIQKTIKELKGKITIFIIAHQPSTIMNCDRLIILDSGKVKEEGSPKALLKNPKSYFHKVYTLATEKGANI